MPLNMRNFLDLPPDVLLDILSDYIEVDSLARLDSAVAHHKQRSHFLALLRVPFVVFRSPTEQPPEFFEYITSRGIQISQVTYKMTRQQMGSLSRSSSMGSQSGARVAVPTLTPLSRQPSASSTTTLLGTPGKLSRSNSLSVSTSTAMCNLSPLSPMSPLSPPNTSRSRAVSFSVPTPEQYPALHSVTRRLRGLSLDATSGLTPEDVATAYTQHGHISKELEHVSITGYKKLEDKQLRPLLDLCIPVQPQSPQQQVTSVDLSGCWRLSDDTLLTIAQRLTLHLRTLRLTACFALTRTGLSMSFSVLPRLQTVSLAYCDVLDDALLQTLLQSCMDLRSLHLSACVALTDEAGLLLSQHARALQVLDVSQVRALTDQFLEYIGSPSPPVDTRAQQSTVPSYRDMLWRLSEQKAVVPVVVPPLQLRELIVDCCAQLTTSGVKRFLQQPHVTQTLRVLSVRGCGQVQSSEVVSLVVQQQQQQQQQSEGRERSLSVSV